MRFIFLIPRRAALLGSVSYEQELVRSAGAQYKIAPEVAVRTCGGLYGGEAAKSIPRVSPTNRVPASVAPSAPPASPSSSSSEARSEATQRRPEGPCRDDGAVERATHTLTARLGHGATFMFRYSCLSI